MRLSFIGVILLILPRLVVAQPLSLPNDPPTVDQFTVPNGSADDLLKYLRGLNATGPTSSSRESIVEYAKSRYTAQLLAADKILAAKPTPEQAMQAVRAKVAALQNLGRAGDKSAAERLKAIPAEIEKLGMKDILKVLNFNILEGRLIAAPAMSGEEQKEIVDDVERVLKEGPIDGATTHLAFATATRIEYAGNAKLAAQAYETFAKYFIPNDDHHISDEGAMFLGAARRLNLVGKAFHLEGKTHDGRPFNWSAYRGKIVLVNFFKASLPASRAELAAVRKNYDAYHSRGLDVVTVCIDRDRKALEDMLDKEKLPWTILLDNTEALGTNKSMATYYGVLGVPPLILVARNGKVVAVDLAAVKLADELEKSLK